MRLVVQVVAVVTIFAVACELIPPTPPPDIVITSGFWHLGNDEVTDWPEVRSEPDGTRLDLEFVADAMNTECTLVLTQRDVDNDWFLRINDQDVCQLQKVKDSKTICYPVAGGLLRNGTNRFVLEPAVVGDDIVIGNVQLIMRPMREVLGLGKVRVRVTDRDTGDPVPVRLAVTDLDGRRAPIYFAESPRTAIRDGIAYTADGAIDLEIAAGTYEIAATRGMEWSLGRAQVEVVTGGEEELPLTLTRSVDTTGFVACDTHVHTLTYSGHGDSSVEERLVTLAGEGVELAIATDHNHNTDYRPLQHELDLNAEFTSVVGNEVTTDNGHFNAFPLDPDDEVPPWKLTDWVALVDGMRAKGAGVVVFNHPRWPDEGHPLERFGFDPISGERREGPDRFTFDAMELINSDSLLDDPRMLLHDWFGVLNHGDPVTAVGSSDSHAVGVIVGQGRTYVRSSTDDADQIDIAEMVESFRGGRTSVSMGIFADVVVNGHATMGDVVPMSGGSPVTVSLRVAAPAWVRPEVAELYRNGSLVATRNLEPVEGEPTDLRIEFETTAPPSHDAHLVCVVTGPGIDGAWWPTARDYTFAATNPVYLDVDDDGEWTSPRATVTAWLDDTDSDLPRLLDSHLDPAVVVQLFSVLKERRRTDLVSLSAAALSRYGEDPMVRGYLDPQK